MRVFDAVQSWKPHADYRPARALADAAVNMTRHPKAVEYLEIIKRQLRRKEHKLKRRLEQIREKRYALIGGDYLEWLREVSLNAHVFQVAPVTAYYWQHRDDQPSFGDFPAPIPAIPLSWFEGTRQDGERFGALLQSGPLDGTVESALSRKRLGQIANSESRFFVDAHVIYLNYDEYGDAEPWWQGRFSWTVDARQNIGPGILWLPPSGMATGFQLLRPTDSVAVDQSTVLGGLLLSLSLLHCKNVTLESAPGARQFRRARERSGRPVVEYKTLVIEPMARALGANLGGGGWENRFHICRGHFKEYDARPLFGRIRGRFWWAAHTKGNAQLGSIAKQYAESGVGV